MSIQQRHIETRRTARSLLTAVLVAIGAVLVVAALAAEVRNPFAVLAEKVQAATDNRRD